MARAKSMTANAVKKREAYARQKAEASARIQPDTTVPLSADSMPDFEVEVSPPADTPKQSLKDRIFGAMPATAKAKPEGKAKAKATKARTDQIDANLIKQLIPLTISSLIATQSRNLISEPYKVCAPEQQEAMAMIAPYFSILSRYVELTGQLNDNLIDLIMAALASLLYGTRAFTTYIKIKEYEAIHHDGHLNRNGHPGEQRGGTNAAAGGGGPDPTATDERSGQAIAGTIRSSSEPNTYAGYGPIDAGGGDNSESGGEAALMAGLFARDFAGRQQMGLLPRAI